MQAVPLLLVPQELSQRHSFPRCVFLWFSRSNCKTKSPHCCVSFLFWKPASTYSPGHVSASHIALFFASRHTMPRTLALRAICSFSRRENAKPLATLLVPRELSRRSLIFTPRGCLAGHGNVCSASNYKTKSPHCCVSFLFWKPASTYSPHTLPGRVQPSTICADELNFCVRYENRWDLIAIDTGNC